MRLLRLAVFWSPCTILGVAGASCGRGVRGVRGNLGVCGGDVIVSLLGGWVGSAAFPGLAGGSASAAGCVGTGGSAAWDRNSVAKGLSAVMGGGLFLVGFCGLPSPAILNEGG